MYIVDYLYRYYSSYCTSYTRTAVTTAVLGQVYMCTSPLLAVHLYDIYTTDVLRTTGTVAVDGGQLQKQTAYIIPGIYIYVSMYKVSYKYKHDLSIVYSP